MDTRGILQLIEHRPFALPEGPWIMTQVWHEVLFAHWPLESHILRPLIPDQLDLDTFDGMCWLGVVPFRMSHIRARGIPPFPGLSRFPELNVRTYVRFKGTPGVYFFSLDAANVVAVALANTFFSLPYIYASMQSQQRDDVIAYKSSRPQSGVPEANFIGRYHAVSPVAYAARDTQDYWLTERYCFFTAGKQGRIYRGDIHHAPWPLQKANLTLETNSMGQAHGIHLSDQPTLLHYALRQDVLVWPLHRA